MKKLLKETGTKKAGRKGAGVKQAGRYLAAAAVMTAMMCGTAYAGSWQQRESGWLYVHDDGRTGLSEWVQEGGRYYRINEAGWMHTGWYQDLADAGRWYYLNPNQGGPQGAMVTGWVMVNGRWYFLDTRVGGPQGGMLTGWQWIDGKCYYLDPAQGGALFVSGVTPDGYRVDGNGAWVDANGNPVYEAGKGIPSVAAQGTAGPGAGGSAASGGISGRGSGGSGSGGSGSGGSGRGSSVSSSKDDSEWDDYSDSSVRYSANDFENGNYSKMDEDEREETEDAIEDFKDEYITDEMSDFEKEITIIQWLVENCRYESGDGWENATAYSCIVKGNAQCSGYADAFLQTAKACGLEARYVYNSTHAWNLVKLDGDWYHVDVTWEDPVGDNGYGFGKLRNKYINLEDSQIKGIRSHHTWNPSSASAKGTDYGPQVVANYLKNGKIDTSLGESFEDTMDEFFDSVANEDGSNLFTYGGVGETADSIIEYLGKQLDNKEDSFSFVIRYPDSYSASVNGNYSKLVDLNNDIEDKVNKAINEQYEKVLKNDIKISLYLEVDANSCYYVHETGKIYYKEGQGKQIPYTIHFISAETGEEVGTQTGTGEKSRSIDLKFPEGYSWISNSSENYEVNEGKAHYSGDCFQIQGTSEVDMDVRLRTLKKKTETAKKETQETAKDETAQKETKAAQKETKAEQKETKAEQKDTKAEQKDTDREDS